jgi:CheY-like chemotaxis protein
MIETEKRILVVDDDDAIRALLMTILRRRGLKVDMARNGRDGLERCTRCHYALVLLDLMMPQMSGYDFLDEIARMPVDERPVVIVLTAGSVQRALDADVVAGSVRKPFDIEFLVETVSACLTTCSPRPQLDECAPADSETAGSRSDEPPN